MKITFCLIFITTFRLLQHLQVIFSSEKKDFEKRTQMHINLECSVRKYKSARAPSFGKCTSENILINVSPISQPYMKLIINREVQTSLKNELF